MRRISFRLGKSGLDTKIYAYLRKQSLKRTAQCVALSLRHTDMNQTTQLILVFFLLCGQLYGQSSEYPGLVVLRPCSFHVIPPKDTTPTDKFITIQIGKKYDLSACESDTNTFYFYKDPDNSSRLKSLSFFSLWGPDGGVKLVEIDSISWLDPVYSELENNDFCSLVFMCKKRHGKWLEVVSNDSTKTTMWIEKSKFTTFIPWNHVSRKVTVGKACVKLSSDQVIYKRPNENSNSIDNPKSQSSFEIIEAKKDWLKISNNSDEYFDLADDESPITGWIRYKDGEKLLIDFEIK